MSDTMYTIDADQLVRSEGTLVVFSGTIVRVADDGEYAKGTRVAFSVEHGNAAEIAKGMLDGGKARTYVPRWAVLSEIEG